MILTYEWSFCPDHKDNRKDDVLFKFNSIYENWFPNAALK